MNRKEIFNQLAKVFIFSTMEKSDVARIALRFKPVVLNPGDTVYEQGNPANGFYVIVSGKIRLINDSGRRSKDYGILTSRDFFGAEELVLKKSRILTARVESATTLLRINPKDFYWMLQTYPALKNDLVGMVKGIRLGRKKQFNWLGKEEVIHVISRKNIALLWFSLTGPIIFGGISILLAVAGLFVSPKGIVLGIIGGVLFVVALLWAIWSVIDWGNDYYIITNQRVVWLEKVIGLYDSRQESPINAVLSVNVTSDQAQRMIGTGDVIVRTYTGSIVFRNVDRPSQFASAINAYWEKSKELSRISENEEMERAIHERLYENSQNNDLPGEQLIVQTPTAPLKKNLWERMFGNFLRMRYEEGDNITYRKHWYIFIKKSWQPLVVFVFLTTLILFLYWPFRETSFAFVAGTTALIVWVTLYLVVLVWWLYYYVDWRNDIYILTLDKILDIERKPLGREEKKTSPLESVLSLEHTREGILGLLFNFGNVVINVGSTKLIFYGVHNPAEVQHDIFDRMYALRKSQEKERAEQDRQRMVEWLSIYKRETEEAKEKNDKTPDFY